MGNEKGRMIFRDRRAERGGFGYEKMIARAPDRFEVEQLSDVSATGRGETDAGVADGLQKITLSDGRGMPRRQLAVAKQLRQVHALELCRAGSSVFDWLLAT